MEKLVELLSGNGHQVTFARKATGGHVITKLRERSNTLKLYARILCAQIAILFGMTGIVTIVGTQNVLGEEILRIATRTRAHRHHK